MTSPPPLYREIEIIADLSLPKFLVCVEKFADPPPILGILDYSRFDLTKNVGPPYIGNFRL